MLAWGLEAMSLSLTCALVPLSPPLRQLTLLSHLRPHASAGISPEGREGNSDKHPLLPSWLGVSLPPWTTGVKPSLD